MICQVAEEVEGGVVAGGWEFFEENPGYILFCGAVDEAVFAFEQ